MQRHDGIRLRQMREGERNLVRAMVRALYAESGWAFDAAAERGLDAALAGHPNVRVWMIEAGGEVCGYVVLTLGFSVMYGGVDTFLDEFFIVPDFRGGGLGGRALALVADAARELGAVFIHLEVNTDARARNLYRRCGFEEHAQALMSLDLRN